MPSSTLILTLPPLPPTQKRENQWPWVLEGPHPRMVKGGPEMDTRSQSPHGLGKQCPSTYPQRRLFSTWQGGMEEKNGRPQQPRPCPPGGPSGCSSKTAVPQNPGASAPTPRRGRRESGLALHG